MRGRNLCYYHIRASAKPNPRPTGMPSLEDGNAIQLGLAEVIRRVLCYDIDYKAAYCLLHAYKLALWNLKNVNRDPYYKDVVTVDPASDPANAADMTEPLTYTQLAARENPQPEVENEHDELPNQNDEEISFQDFLMNELIDPDANQSTTHEGAPPNRSGFERLGGTGDETGSDLTLPSRAKSRELASDSSNEKRENRNEKPTFGKPETGNREPTQESEGRHYLAQAPLACPERLSVSEEVERVSPGTGANQNPSPAGTAPRREVQRITIPKEIGELMKAEAEEERFMQAATALFNNTKAG